MKKKGHNRSECRLATRSMAADECRTTSICSSSAAGSGGVRAARIAAGYGARVMIAEEYRVGGTCVIRGCVPKKLLVYASRFADEFEDAAGYGWTRARADVRLADADRQQGHARSPGSKPPIPPTSNAPRSTIVKSRAVLEDRAHGAARRDRRDACAPSTS